MYNLSSQLETWIDSDTVANEWLYISKLSVEFASIGPVDHETGVTAHKFHATSAFASCSRFVE